MSDDLDELARRGREARDSAPKKRREKSNSDDPDTPERVYARSFVGEPPKQVWIPLMLASFAVLACTAVLLHDALPQWLENAASLVWSVVIGVWFVIIFSWRTVSQQYVHREHVWQAELPYAFDAESYKAVLSRRTVRARCIIIVDTGNDDAKTNETISDSLHAYEVDNVLLRRVGIFEVRSKVFDTATDSEYDSVFTNLPLHRFFKRYSQNVLLPLHAMGFVKSVRVESRE